MTNFPDIGKLRTLRQLSKEFFIRMSYQVLVEVALPVLQMHLLDLMDHVQFFTERCPIIEPTVEEHSLPLVMMNHEVFECTLLFDQIDDVQSIAVVSPGPDCVLD